MHRLLIVLGLLIIGCTDEETVDSATFAVDTDGNGSVDCTDLDHVLACLHDHVDACAAADVNHDGSVDDTDLHDIHAGMEATGHHCSSGSHHHEDGHHH